MKKIKESRKHVIRHGKTDIANMWLDGYDDIFSDFDPSPYSHRLISDDFISEAKKICFDKKDLIKEFNLYIPDHLRDNEKEDIIKKRLHAFFQKKLENFNQEFRQVRNKGILFAFLGIVLLTIITYLLSVAAMSGYLQIIFIVTEPARWFLIWMGLDYIFFINKPRKPDLEFYNKVYSAEICFHSTSGI